MANNVRCCFSLLQNITVILFLKVESQYFCAYLFTTVNPSACCNKYHSINRFPRIKNAAPRILKALKLLYMIWLRGETSRNFQQRLYKQTNFRWRVSVVQVLFVWIIIIIAVKTHCLYLWAFPRWFPFFTLLKFLEPVIKMFSSALHWGV